MWVIFEKNSEIVKELCVVFQQGDIVFWFQLQVDIYIGFVVGVEVLVWWIDYGEVCFLGVFLLVVEEVGYMEFIEIVVCE